MSDTSYAVKKDFVGEENYTLNGEKIPPLFCKENRVFWIEVRRFLIWLCRKIGEYYNLDNAKV